MCGPLIDRLQRSLAGVAWQAIFVDDNSPDGTAAVVKAIAARDPRVLCLHRVGRRGLAGAVIEGRHGQRRALRGGDRRRPAARRDPAAARCWRACEAGDADLVVGSRYPGRRRASTQGLSPLRKAGSRARQLAGRDGCCKAEVTDPMSGFFMIRRELVEAVAPQLSRPGLQGAVRHHGLAAPPLRSWNCPTRSARAGGGQQAGWAGGASNTWA